jgi:16S rRNA (guanine527-N7)-methyltransferase
MSADRAAARLGALAEQYGLTRIQRAQLARLLAVLEHDEHAPTAVRDPERALDAHVADSLVALGVPGMRTASTIADLGAGAGFPGVALAVALPTAGIRLVESQRRRCEFLERLCTVAELENTVVVCARAEEWVEGAREHDAVVARALARQAVVLEYAAPLLRVGGTLVDWRAKREPEEEGVAARAADELGLSLVEIRRVAPFEDARDRHLHVFRKLADTPGRFPRRAGVARKRPLGGPSDRDRR